MYPVGIPCLARSFLDPKLIHANEGSWILGFEAIPKIKIDHRAVFRKLPTVTPQESIVEEEARDLRQV